jgi:hypothetical protein
MVVVVTTGLYERAIDDDDAAAAAAKWRNTVPEKTPAWLVPRNGVSQRDAWGQDF